MSARTILVTGAGGFIGRHLVQHLQERSQGNVVGWTRQRGDLRDTQTVQIELANLRPDVIFHLAAQLPGRGANDWTLVADEQAMVGNLVYAMPNHCRFIYSGSMAEYGRSGVLSETDACHPDTAYGSAKLAGTTLSLALRSQLGLDIHVARLFGVYGPGEAPSRLFPSLISALMARRPCQLSDGLQIRDFLHVDDVCRLLCCLAEVEASSAIGMVNLGTGVGVRVKDACLAIAASLDVSPDLLCFGAVPRRATDKDCLVANTILLERFSPLPPQHFSDQALVEKIVSGFILDMGEKLRPPNE